MNQLSAPDRCLPTKIVPSPKTKTNTQKISKKTSETFCNDIRCCIIFHLLAFNLFGGYSETNRINYRDGNSSFSIFNYGLLYDFFAISFN